MDINIVIAKRDREENYDIFLYYLNKISRGHDVKVYVTSSRDTLKYPGDYFKYLENIYVNHICTPAQGFNKSVLLNQGLTRMSRHRDVVCIMDIDMIYNPDFFAHLQHMIEDGCDYIVSAGQNLNQASTFEIFEKIPNISWIKNMPGQNFTGCSQISMTEHTLDLLLNIFGTIYDKRFMGWGGEDSDLSYKSTLMSIKGLIDKRKMIGAWNHLKHPSKKPAQVESTPNYKLYVRNKSIISKTVADYIDKKF